jgi:hypothetical protein
MKTCSLCGEKIIRKDRSVEHVPPKQFYPKSMREEINAPFWTVPSHKGCNATFKLDEEYLYHYLVGLVFVQNEAMGRIILEDLKRQAKNPQTRGLIRRLISETKTVTPGGIHLPPGHFRVEYDMARIRNVIIKITQCLFFKDHERFMPRANCKHFELCENPQDLQPLFELLHSQKANAIEPKVFSYRHFCLDGTHLYSLLLWEAFAFCLAFENPKPVNENAAEQ